MKHFSTKPILVWLGILLIISCQPNPSELIDFGVSEGVMNNMEFHPLSKDKGNNLLGINLQTIQGKSLSLKNLKVKRPMLLITGSYTCDITRRNLLAIDSLYEK